MEQVIVRGIADPAFDRDGIICQAKTRVSLSDRLNELHKGKKTSTHLRGKYTT
jgi:hypothetical protein